MAERQLLDNVPLQWLLRFARTPVIVPIEALLVALTSDVAVNVVSTNRRRMVIGRPSTDWHASGEPRSLDLRR
jgi:hypothetical protein